MAQGSVYDRQALHTDLHPKPLLFISTQPLVVCDSHRKQTKTKSPGVIVTLWTSKFYLSPFCVVSKLTTANSHWASGAFLQGMSGGRGWVLHAESTRKSGSLPLTMGHI